MLRIGSQCRETLAEAEMTIIERLDDERVILASVQGSDLYELWVMNDHYSGYVIEIDGKGYEFVSSY